jgi:hypothetical protein
VTFRRGVQKEEQKMIEIMSGLPEHVLGFTARGKVTGNDYEAVLIPAIEEKLKKHAKVNLLYHLGADYAGFDLEAMWDDTKIGLQHLTAWQKIAVVTDVDWIRLATKAFGFAMPGHVRVFANNQFDEARAWVSA